MSLKVGDKAPDFTLPSFTPSPELKNISLHDYKGKNVVLLFFPQSFTGGCTSEMCEMSESKYNNLNANILGISIDGTFVQKAFAKANNVTFPLLSDFSKEIVKLYDVYLPEFAHGMKGVAKRSVFIIDKDGVIKYVEVTPTPGDQINFEALTKAVASL